jgi:hypothetical protein
MFTKEDDVQSARSRSKLLSTRDSKSMNPHDWRTDWRIGVIAITFTLCLILFDRTNRVKADTLASACDLSEVTSLNVYNWQTESETTLSGEIRLQSLGEWTGEGTWVRSGDYGYFDQPDDLTWYLSITATLSDGQTRFLYVERSPSTPESMYLFAFVDLRVNADANGNHFGAHHLCAYWRVPSEVVSAWVPSRLSRVSSRR